MEDKRFNWKDAKVTLFGRELIGVKDFRRTHKEQREHDKFVKSLRGNVTKIRIPRKLKKHIKARTNIIQAPAYTLITMYNLGWRSDNKIKLGRLTIN
jgi:hypothetical protein